MLLCVVLSGCKATSTLTVSLGENASGTIHFELVLDEDAASTLRRDSFDSTTLTKLFDVSELKEAGFEVDVKDNANGESTIDISASFSNESELRAALSVLAPKSVVKATLDSTSTFLIEKHSVSLVVDVAKLRSLYLDDPKVKEAVETAGIEYSEFEALVDGAMKSTTLNVMLKEEDKTASAQISGTDTVAKKVAISNESARVRYHANLAAAAIALIIALVLIWRTCRTPRLVSEVTPQEATQRHPEQSEGPQ